MRMVGDAALWLRRAGIVTGVFFGAPALAQSERLLDAVRLHSEDARTLARAERKACAAAKPECASLPQLTLLSGYLALSEGEAEEARALLESGAPPEGLEPWHHFYLGQALFYTRDYARAAEAFAQAQKRGPASLSERARARHGEALLQAGQAKAALPTIEHTTRGGGPELLHLRARAREAAGKKKDAREDRVLLALKYPAHPLGVEAWETLRAQKPRFHPSPDQRMQRARALLDAGRAKDALAELDQMAKEKVFKTAARAPLLAAQRATALYALGEDARADEAVTAAMKGPRPVAAEAAMARARRALRTGDRPRAKTLMKAVAEDFARERPAEDALFLAGWIALQQGETADAVRTFEQFAEKFPAARRNDEVLWFRALTHLKAEQYDAARAVLDELVRKHPRSSLLPQARYWAARAAQLGGAKDAQSVAAYAQVASVHAPTFYGQLARVRLGELGEEAPVAFKEKPGEREEAIPAELALAQRLTRAGLFRDAHLEVETRLSAVRGADAAVRYGHALARIGAYGHAYKLAVRHLWGRALTEREPAAVALMYPLAYRRTVEKEAKAQGIPPWLVWAIMRRESAFRPEVTSLADARGLMQIIPPTARAIAKELGETPPPPDALYAPEVNIRYGAWYLGKLKERFGHPALVAAAYNAGPTAVLGWVKTNRELPLDLFVELIPYKETRGYVKTVLGDFYLYQSLYEAPGKVGKVSFTIPEPGEKGVEF